MPSVTVNGSSGSFVVVNYDTAAYANLATSLLGPDQTNGYLIVSAGSTAIPDGSVVTGIGTTDGSGLGGVSVADLSSASDQLILVGNGTDILLTAAEGSGTIIAGDGADTFAVSSGTWDIFTGADGSEVFTGAASGLVSMGGPDTVVAGSGNETVFGAAVSGGEVFGGSGFLTYAAGDGDSTLVAGSGTVFGFGGAGNSTYYLGSGTAVLVGSTGDMSVQGGSGFTEYFGTDGSTVDFSGASDNNLFVAGSGNETLNAAGATGSNVFYAGTGADSITAGSGLDILFGGTGNSTLTGGAGPNIFAFVDQADGSSSMDTVTDFTSDDKLELINGVDITSQDTSSGNDVVSLTDGTTVTFTGLSSDIGSSQIFHF